MTKIFVNLPVADVAAAREFYTGLGYTVNEEYSGEHSACMVINDAVTAMLLSHSHFSDFISKDIADAATTTSAIFALNVDTRGEVDRVAERALELGGGEPKAPKDHGFMYVRSFSDLDGHHWELATFAQA
ncbi:VOC family protein [Actinokineospora soli]|uniref:VOC family protein n=1 Tax=Actinokineospora soli TaxID=1048753 RepID=A0ABW2TW94_9PSEU